jgi:uncharacterized DUF497 family protein
MNQEVMVKSTYLTSNTSSYILILDRKGNMGRTIISDCGRFEWDEDKNILNIDKHGLSFEVVTPLFDDPYELEFYDTEHSENEDRYFTIGNIHDTNVILVTAWSTERSPRTRLISARLADKKEEVKYYEHWKKINS